MNPFYRRPEFFGLWWEPYMMLFINLLYVAEVLILDFPLWLLLLIVVPMNSLYLVLRIRKWNRDIAREEMFDRAWNSRLIPIMEQADEKAGEIIAQQAKEHPDTIEALYG